MAKKYTGVTTLQALIDIVKADLGDRATYEDIKKMLTTDEIIRDLDAYEAAAEGDNKVVAAALIKELKTKVDTLTGGGEGGAAVTEDKILTTWEGYNPDSDAAKVVAAAVVKAIKDQVDALDTTVTEQITNQKGKPDGLATLDDTGKVPASQLPSYVDDVVEGFMTKTGTDEAPVLTFYEPDEAGTAASTTEIVGEKGKIYVDLTTNWAYRWSGTTFVKVDSTDLIELTESDVETIWNEVKAELEAAG